MDKLNSRSYIIQKANGKRTRRNRRYIRKDWTEFPNIDDDGGDENPERRAGDGVGGVEDEDGDGNQGRQRRNPKPIQRLNYRKKGGE